MVAQMTHVEHKGNHQMNKYIFMLTIAIIISACGGSESEPDKVIIEPVLEQPVDLFIANMEGLPLDEFIQQSFPQLLLRDPELVLYEGLSKEVSLDT